MITLDDVQAAAGRLAGVAHRTPVITGRSLDEATGAERKAMNRVKGLGLTRRYGWYRGKIDPKDWFVVMDGDTFTRLLRGAGY